MEQREAIKIRCQGAGVLDIRDMEPIQGELKKLSTINKDDFKRRVKKKGVIDPIMIWKHEGRNKILSGTQRWTVLTELRAEGHIVPPIPVNFVEAGTLKEAKDHLLDFVSVYGKVTEQGLFDFLSDNIFSPEELAEFKIPEFDMLNFIDKNINGLETDFLDISPQSSDGLGLLSANPAQVRMKQLFFNEVQCTEFLQKVKDLQDHYAFNNITDTVLEAVRESHKTHCST